MAFIQVGELSVCYEIHGTGPRVLLLSGTGADLRQNPKRGSGLLEQHHEVLMYDQRGLGRTSKPDRPYSMADYADDAAALMDAVGWSRAHVVGISFGGMVAQHLALRHPDRVDRLVLACTAAGGAAGASFDLLSVADLSPEERVKKMLPISDTRNDPDADPPVYAPLFDWLVKRMAKPPLNADEPNAAIGARRQLQARAEHDVSARLGEITAPTFAVGGHFDGQASPQAMRKLADGITNATLQFFDGGHLFLLQDKTTWPAIVEFLAR